MDIGNTILSDGVAYGADEENTNEEKSSGQQWKDSRFSKEHGYSFWLRANSVRMFQKGFSLPKTLTATEKGYMYDCAMMLQANTNMIVKHYCNYDIPANSKIIADELGINLRSCQRFLKSMKEKNIIKEDNGLLYVNPIFFICGKYLSWHLYKLFQEDLDHFLPSWVIDRFNGDDRA